MSQLTLRVHYPLAQGDLRLRCDLDWGKDVQPVAESVERTLFEFELDLPHPYLYFKPVLVEGDVVRWSQGNDYLTFADRGSIDVYPHFFDDPACGVGLPIVLPSTSYEMQHTLRVFTPPGYHENPLSRFPALYMHDGQNLFFPGEAFGGHEWRIDETVAVLTSMNLIREAIVVGLYPQERMSEYTLPGYESFGRYLVEEVKPWIDARHRTLTDAANTAVMGSSLGGVVSFYLAWQWPQIFGHAGCLSSTFGYRDDLYERVASEEKRPLRLYLDSGWPGDNYETTRALNDLLVDRGYTADELLYLAFPGAQHNEEAWALRAHIPFQHFFRR